MKIYYESLINLLEKNEELSKICEQVGMCFHNEAGVTLGDNGKFVYLIKKNVLLSASLSVSVLFYKKKCQNQKLSLNQNNTCWVPIDAHLAHHIGVKMKNKWMNAV